jgi:type II secretory pathway component PulK
MRTGAKEGVSGSVLILALWVLFSLAALTIATASRVMAVLSAAERLGQRAQARAQGWAGSALAVAVISEEFDRTAGQGTNAVSGIGTNSPTGIGTNSAAGWDGLQSQSFSRDADKFNVMFSRGGRDTVISIGFETSNADGKSVTNSGVLGEESRVNLNLASSNVLAAIIRKAAEIGPADAEVLAAAILHRRGDHDEMLTAGTGNGYYSQEKAPSQGAGKPLRTLDELLLIPGVDAELVKRLEPYVTVYGSGRININAASVDILEVLGGASAGGLPAGGGSAASLADKIARFREAGNAFERPVYLEIRTALEQFEPLTGDEGAVLTAMASGLDVKSTAFGGTVYAGEGPGAREDDDLARLVDFVWDTEERRYVMWREW